MIYSSVVSFWPDDYSALTCRASGGGSSENYLVGHCQDDRGWTNLEFKPSEPQIGSHLHAKTCLLLTQLWSEVFNLY